MVQGSGSRGHRHWQRSVLWLGPTSVSGGWASTVLLRCSPSSTLLLDAPHDVDATVPAAAVDTRTTIEMVLHPVGGFEPIVARTSTELVAASGTAGGEVTAAVALEAVATPVPTYDVLANTSHGGHHRLCRAAYRHPGHQRGNPAAATMEPVVASAVVCVGAVVIAPRWCCCLYRLGVGRVPLPPAPSLRSFESG